jgi:hypothetical protein
VCVWRVLGEHACVCVCVCVHRPADRAVPSSLCHPSAAAACVAVTGRPWLCGGSGVRPHLRDARQDVSGAAPLWGRSCAGVAARARSRALRSGPATVRAPGSVAMCLGHAMAVTPQSPERRASQALAARTLHWAPAGPPASGSVTGTAHSTHSRSAHTACLDWFHAPLSRRSCWPWARQNTQHSAHTCTHAAAH